MNENLPPHSSDEISFKELIQKLGEWYRYLKTQWWKIAIAGILGGVIGFVYAWMQPVTYTAKTTFVVEDTKSGGGGLSGLASLAGQFGVDVGGGAGGGLIAGDNILLYFQSESLARDVLLTSWDSSRNESLADHYIDAHGLKVKWAANPKIGTLKFHPFSLKEKYSRLQDSLLQSIVKHSILKYQLSISKIEKRAGFIQLSITMENEELAAKYCYTLIKAAISKYISLKTLRQQKTVDKLQSRVDSIHALLNQKTTTFAAQQIASSTMDVNPLYKAGSLAANEKTVRDKAMLATVYSEIVKNLELAKFTLSQETPVIEVLDTPILPLPSKKASKLYYSFIYCIFFLLLSIMSLIAIRLFYKLSK